MTKVKLMSFAKVFENLDKFLRISKVSFSNISIPSKTALKNSTTKED